MGLLRYLLASLVLASHLGHTVLDGINPGVAAVVVFYMLAGHVVAGLWQKWHQQPGALAHFYADRLWRILPQYYAAAAVAALLWWAGAQSPFLSAQPSALHWLAQLSVVPLSYYMYTGGDHFVLLPPAWSLGVELQFYALAPFLVLLRLRWLALAMAASLAVFVAAQLQWLHTDHFGYRLLPGVLFLFLTGAWLRRCTASTCAPLLLLWGAMLVYLLWLWGAPPAISHQPYRRDVALGLVLGLPVLALLQVARQRWAGRLGRLPGLAHLARLDAALASASYGVFLWHFPVLWALPWLVLSPLLPPLPPGSSAQLLWVCLLTSACALAAHVAIERPAWRLWRRQRLLVKPPKSVAPGFWGAK